MVATIASTANLGLTLMASASRHSSTASMQRSRPIGRHVRGHRRDLLRHVGMVGARARCARRDQQRVAKVGGQVDQRTIQRVTRRPGLARLLPSLKVFDRSGRPAQRAGRALPGAAGTQRCAQLLSLGFVAVGRQNRRFGLGGGHQRLGRCKGLRPGRGIAGQTQRLQPPLAAPPGRWQAVGPGRRGRR